MRGLGLAYLLQRLTRAARILQTPYRRLLLNDLLNSGHLRFTVPAVKMLSTVEKYKVLEMGKIRFFWPSEYGKEELPGLYYDTFAPAEVNPHAFEVDNIRICPGDWVVDAGACEGFFTHLALQRGAKVLMVEPVPRLAQALSRTFAQEIEQGRVRLIEGVLNDTEGDIELTIPPAGAIGATIDSGWIVDADWRKQESMKTGLYVTTVNAYTLDSLVETGTIPRIDFLKMDIENGEIAAIRGANRVLRLQTPKLAIAVYHDFLNAQIIRSLILEAQPAYNISWRGIFMRESFGPPRPYMLHASSFSRRS